MRRIGKIQWIILVCAILLSACGRITVQLKPNKTQENIEAPSPAFTILMTSPAENSFLNTAINAGARHTCALVNGAAKCWGLNNFGQLGNNSNIDSYIPVDIVGLSSNVTAINAGSWHTCALVNGAAKCWGYNLYGQLGNNSNINSYIPVDVVGLGTSLAISGTCSENGGLVEIKYNNSILSSTTCQNGAFSSSIDISSIPEGSFTITATLSDTAGHSAFDFRIFIKSPQ